MDNCELIYGHARFESSHAIRVDDRLIEADKIFLNTGGRAVVPDILGLSDIDYLTNTSILALDRVPEHLVVVGGSYVGLEFAQIYRRFGARVTVVEMGPRLVSREDEDVSRAIAEILEAEGIEIRTDAKCIGFSPHPGGVSLKLDCHEGARHVEGACVLLAVGRRPNTDDLGLERAGVAWDERGYIRVDDGLATNVPHIWALGDCNGRGAFTHTSYNDYEIVAANLLDGQRRKVSDRVEGYALYIDPPLGRAGMTEAQARASGRRISIATRPMTRVSRAVERDETKGFIKIVADADTKEILGAAILGIEGDEAIHGILDMMNAKAPYTAISRTIPVVGHAAPISLGAGCFRLVPRRPGCGLGLFGVGRVLLVQQRPPGGGCRSWPIQHLVMVVAGAG